MQEETRNTGIPTAMEQFRFNRHEDKRPSPIYDGNVTLGPTRWWVQVVKIYILAKQINKKEYAA